MNFGGRLTAPRAPYGRMHTESDNERTGHGEGRGGEPSRRATGTGTGADTCDARADRELLAAHLAGDARAFPALIDRHERQLWWTARRHSRTESDAADALQDALVKALRSAPAFRHDASVATWLHRIVVNSCHDRMRGRHGPPDGVVDERLALDAAVPGPGEEDPSLTVVMRQAVARLPEEQRRVIIEVDVMGWPVADAARRLGIPEGTVKSRRARARAALRRHLHRLQPEVAR